MLYLKLMLGIFSDTGVGGLPEDAILPRAVDGYPSHGSMTSLRRTLRGVGTAPATTPVMSFSVPTP